MRNPETHTMRDPYLESIIEAKGARSVVKTEFAQAISSVPEDHYIFGIEGVHDSHLYYQWIRLSSPHMKYEFFRCGNKDKALKLHDSLQVDRTKMGERVYFLVDRDFDDLQGRGDCPRVFMTDKYSIENYLVSEEVVNDILRIDFHCNGAGEVRRKIIDIFTKAYDEHLAATKELNFRIFASKRIGLALPTHLPERINQLSKVSLRTVERTDQMPASVIPLARELTGDEEIHLRTEFDRLSPRDRYRGKFAFCFLIRWLELLREERKSCESSLFSPLPLPEGKVQGGFSIQGIAARSTPPDELKTFLAAI